MKRILERLIDVCWMTALTVLPASLGWAGPPGPPVITPTTPVGGTDVLFGVAVAVAGYGWWKARGK